MRRLVVGLAVLVAATGCTTESPAAPPPAGGESWMEDLCAAGADLRAGLWGSASGTEPLRQRLRGQLDTASGEVDTALDRLAELPPAPVDGGDTAVAELGDELTDLRDALVRGRDDLDALPAAAGEDQLGRVLGAVWPRAAARAADPFAGVAVSDAMKAAATGPDCTALPL